MLKIWLKLLFSPPFIGYLFVSTCVYCTKYFIQAHLFYLNSNLSESYLVIFLQFFFFSFSLSYSLKHSISLLTSFMFPLSTCILSSSICLALAASLSFCWSMMLRNSLFSFFSRCVLRISDSCSPERWTRHQIHQFIRSVSAIQL